MAIKGQSDQKELNSDKLNSRVQFLHTTETSIRLRKTVHKAFYTLFFLAQATLSWACVHHSPEEQEFNKKADNARVGKGPKGEQNKLSLPNPEAENKNSRKATATPRTISDDDDINNDNDDDSK